MAEVLERAAQSARYSAALVLLAALVGCGSAAAPTKVAPAPVKTPAPVKKVSAVAPDRPAPQPKQLTKAPPIKPAPRTTEPPPNLGELLQTAPGEKELNFFEAAPQPKIDDDKVAAHGIRKLAGQHVTLYTDVPSSPAVDELPQVFDAAVPQWQAYFGIADDKVAKWHLFGYLMKDQQKFVDAGLYPQDLPEFPNGFQRGHEFWLHEQPTDYYRRHLMLHEGTHGAMYHWLGGAGPPWYCEGMAELLGTHRWADGKLTVAYVPRDKKEVEGWGRIKIIKDAFAAGTALTIADVMRLAPDAHRQTPAYAWSWGAAEFFDAHPRYQKVFREMGQKTKLSGAEFSTELLTALKPQIHTLQDEWQLFVGNSEYGYDVAANALEIKPVQPLPASGATVEVAANHSWQSSGYVLEANKTYRLTATGRFHLRGAPQPWPSEAGGVTVRYHRGRPLGELQAAVRDDEHPTGVTPLLSPTPIGLGEDFTPKQTGTLWLKLNDHPGEYGDNSGTVKVEVKAK